MVLEIREPDMSCYPYRRKGLYLAIVLPYLAVLVSVLFHLLFGRRQGEPGMAGERERTGSVCGMVYLGLYLGMCYFQAYCCACQECPYIGEFCPAIAGIYPGNMLAKIKYANDGIVKSERALRTNATLASACWVGIMVLPIRRLAKRSTVLAVGYALVHAAYYLFHGLTVCPVCAVRDTCPGGMLQARVLNR